VSEQWFTKKRYHGLVGTAVKPVEILFEAPISDTWREKPIVLICHPNPAASGTMHHKIPTMLARTAEANGFAALRFQFSGVGLTSGPFDRFDRAVELTEALIERIQTDIGHPSKWIFTGFSFGGACALALNGPWPRFAIAPAWPLIESSFDIDRNQKTIVVHAMDDEIVSYKAGCTYFEENKNFDSQWLLLSRGGHFFEKNMSKIQYYFNNFLLQHEGY